MTCSSRLSPDRARPSTPGSSIVSWWNEAIEMKPRAMAAPHVSVHRRRRRAASRVVDRVVHSYLALPTGVAIALIWANTVPERYFAVAHALAFPVNEIGMALFVGLIMQEIVEAVMPG